MFENDRQSIKIAWSPALASTFPHHKHIPPDIKHHRIPAPNISFKHPNLSWLLKEIEAFVENTGE